jgi:hypothetical protein
MSMEPPRLAQILLLSQAFLGRDQNLIQRISFSEDPVIQALAREAADALSDSSPCGDDLGIHTPNQPKKSTLTYVDVVSKGQYLTVPGQK